MVILTINSLSIATNVKQKIEQTFIGFKFVESFKARIRNNLRRGENRDSDL